VIKPGGCFARSSTSPAMGRAHTNHRARQVTVRKSRPTPARGDRRCQVGFNKAFMRVLVDRLTQANLRLAGRGDSLAHEKGDEPQRAQRRRRRSNRILARYWVGIGSMNASAWPFPWEP